jgi:hypothetical protein
MAKGRIGAARRDMIHRTVDVAVRAKVEPVSVDLVPFALIRAVGQDEGQGLEESDAGGEGPQGQAAPTPSPPPVLPAPRTGAGEAQEPPRAITFFGDRDPFVPGTFELVSVSANCARFQFGDESFSLCRGEAPK